MCRRSIQLCVALGLVLYVPPIALGGQTYLSDTDVGYKLIETLQERYCGRNPTHKCNITDDECLRLQEYLWQSIYGQTPDQSSLRQQCLRISTRHELPGMYRILSDLQAEVDAALKRLGLRTVNIKVGSLPVPGVNARIATPPGSGYSVVLFNARFLQFAHEMTKVVARSIPVRYEDETIIIDSEISATERLLQEHPDIERDFHGTILHFLDVQDRPPIQPTEFSLPLLSVYDEGIELFAMAHEYAHAVCGHNGASTRLMLENEDGNFAGAPDGRQLVSKWAQEVEADLLAIAIVEDIWRLRRESPDSHPFNIALLEAPDFYFQLREMVDESRYIRSGSRVPNPSQEEVRAIQELTLSPVSTTCDLGFPRNMASVERHPHPQNRRALLRRRITYPPLNESERALLEIASLLNRNAEILWKRTRASLKAS